MILSGLDATAVQEYVVFITEQDKFTCMEVSPEQISCGGSDNEVYGTGWTVTWNVVVSPKHPLAEATTL